MKRREQWHRSGLACVLGAVTCLLAQSAVGEAGDNTVRELSPAALAVTPDGKTLFVGCAGANQVLLFDTSRTNVSYRLKMPNAPLGFALSRDGARLFVACAAPTSTICIVDLHRRRTIRRIPAGHTAVAPVLSPDEQTLYICNRFNNSIGVIDLAAGREAKRIAVPREPVAAAITPDGRYLVVANHLHSGQASILHVGAVVSMIDTRSLTVCGTIRLTLGAGLMNGIAVSPDGHFAAVTHLRSMYWLTTTEVELGRMNGSALSILDLDRRDLLGTVLLDRTGRGAANPWGVAWSADGKTIAVAHAGTHEISLVNAPEIADPASFMSLSIGAYTPTEKSLAPLPRQSPVRVRARVPLTGNGPRALALAGSQLYVANYFSDDLSRVDLSALVPVAETLPLQNPHTLSALRTGEMFFNDARLCRQQWQSCASCHDADGRCDALNWDLLNDGSGNPKNTRSLLWAHRTGPAMALGVRTNAATAVRAGLHHILFSDQSEPVAPALDAWLKSLRPLPSPYLVRGHLSATAKRGERLFRSERTGCVDCHPPPLFTDMKAHDVGTANQFHTLYFSPSADQPSDRFYSPTLAELWRTAPYLHDGSAATLREVLTSRNQENRHGHTSTLTAQETEDLTAYLMSL